MAFKFGRAGIDISMRDPQAVSITGNDLSITGIILESSFIRAAALRQQLTGSATLPYPIPVVWDADPRVNGYYKIDNVVVGADNVSGFRYRMPYSVQAHKLTQFAQPLWDIQSVGTSKVNYGSLAGWDFAAFGSANGTVMASWKSGQYQSSDFTVAATTTRVTDMGSVYFWYNSTPGTVSNATFGVLPEVFYYGAPRLELAYDGTNYLVASGYQVDNLPTKWRLTNGLVRLTFSGSTTCDFDIAVYNGAAWDAARTFRLTVPGPVNLIPTSIAVTRDDGDSMRIRLNVTQTTSSATAWFLDIGLRRGSRVFEFMMTGGSGLSVQNVVFGRTTNEASTNLTNSGGTVGVRATNNDAQGNRYVLMSTGTVTTDTTVGQITLRGTPTYQAWGLGFELDGTGAVATIDTYTAIQSQYFGGWNHAMRYVGQ